MGWDISANVVSQWKMNDNAANTVVSDAVDSNTGAAQRNTNVMTTGGVIGQGLNFNGSDYINVGDKTNLEVGGPCAFFTWVNLNISASNARTIVSKRHVGVGSEYAFGIANTLYVGVGTPSHWGGQSVIGSATITGWVGVNKFVGVNIDVSGTCSFYVDSVLDKVSEAETGQFTLSGNASFLIGATQYQGPPPNPYNYMNGMLDNTLVINRLLTQDEINGLYNGGAGTEDLALVETPVHIATRYITGKKGISRKDLRKMKNTFPKISYKDQREMSLDFPRINKKDADLMKDDSREIMKDWE